MAFDLEDTVERIGNILFFGRTHPVNLVACHGWLKNWVATRAANFEAEPLDSDEGRAFQVTLIRWAPHLDKLAELHGSDSIGPRELGALENAIRQEQGLEPGEDS